MTVKFSSLHIKRKSPLTFPQTEQAEHWHREGMKKRTKAEKYLTFQTMPRHTGRSWMVLTEAQHKHKVFTHICWGAADLASKTRERWGVEVLQTRLGAVWAMNLSSDWLHKSQPQDLNAASSFSHSVLLGTKRSSMATARSLTRCCRCSNAEGNKAPKQTCSYRLEAKLREFLPSD